MRQRQSDIVIYDSTVTPEADFTAATTDIITSSSHGLSEGDKVRLTTTNTLPAGLSTSTDYYVINPDTNTFKLSATRGGSAVDVTDTGTGTHTYHLKGRTIYVGDFRHAEVHLDFLSSPTMTAKFKGSAEKDAPTFEDSQSGTNRWDYVQVIDLENSLAIDGDTGIETTGSADHRLVQVNTDGINWLAVDIDSWTAGTLGAVATLYNK